MFKFIGLVFLFFSLLLPTNRADALQEETLFSKEVEAGLSHLMNLAGPKNTQNYDPLQSEKLLDFVSAPKALSVRYLSETKKDATFAYHEVDIRRDLNTIIRYAYSPDFPSHLLAPSSLRYSFWQEVEPLPVLRKTPAQIENPVIVRGIEHIENAPDKTTEAYYAYEDHRALILARHKGRLVLISISKQAGVSDVGRKGAVLGLDSDWNYIYTGEKGLGKNGLGWVDSYMYDSCSVMVFYEPDPGTPLVRCGMFKWIRAGWADLNFVRWSHIFEGLERFSGAFKMILEHPRLPPAEELTDIFSRIDNLLLEDLVERTGRYFLWLEKTYGSEGGAKPGLARLKNGKYLQRLTRRDMETILKLEYMKFVLGTSRENSFDYLSGLRLFPDTGEKDPADGKNDPGS